MKDKEFIKHLETTIKELEKRLGKKMCSQLDSLCFDCQTRILIAYLNHWIDVLE